MSREALGTAIKGACLLLRLDIGRESAGKPRFKPLLSDLIAAPVAGVTTAVVQRWRWFL
jgi:hypothetical protein